MSSLASSLRFYWRNHLAIVLGAALATAVLTGALLVGDSVRTSLERLTLERLGTIDHAMVATSFFRAALADDLAAEDASAAYATAVVTRANVVASAAQTRASGVAVIGVEPRFARMFAAAEPASAIAADAVVLSAALAAELGVDAGDEVSITLPRWSAVPRSSLLGRKDSAEVVSSLRLAVAAVIPDRGIGRFSLIPNQRRPKNAFVNLAALQDELGVAGMVNAIFVADTAPATELDAAETAATALDARLADAATAEDLGLELEGFPPGGGAPGFVEIRSRELVLAARVVEAATAVAGARGLAHQVLLSHLANRAAIGDREVAYSSIVALDPASALAASLTLEDGSRPTLAEDGILLNRWAADDLAAKPGDELEMSYFVVDDDESLREVERRFVVRGVVTMSGLGADASLTPKLPGVHDARDMADWDPPFPVDFRRITDRDEDYWDAHRSAPKLFIAEATGRELWRTRHGDATAVRIAVPDGVEPAAFVATVAGDLRRALEPAAFGLSFEPVKARGLDAATGATDFSGLFIGFSLFLIVSAALLVGLLFSLGVERRAGELGLLLATGYPPRQVARRFLGEGMVLAAIGGILGLGGAIAYGWLLMVGLRTRWLPAVGSSDLELAVAPASLAIGYAAALGVTLFAIWRAIRRLAALPATSLLSGRTSDGRAASGSRARRVMVLFLTFATLLLGIALATGRSSPVLFFGVGAALLVGLLGGFAAWCDRQVRTATSIVGGVPHARMAIGASARNPGRSVLSVSLVACAAFVIVAVAVNRRAPGDHLDQLDSPAGGFNLIAESDVPLYHRLDRSDGRFELGMSDRDDQRLRASTVIPARLLPGDDASCLNLYRPERPRVVGVPASLIARGGFEFAATLTPADNPWQLLDEPLEPGVIPAIGDSETVQWILKLGLGEDLPIPTADGGEVELRLVAVLHASIFQSELLISERAFVRHFPDHDGYGFFLVDAPPGELEAVSTALESSLVDYGFDATTTAQRLADYQAVANTYLETFLTLGGLGLLLGTLGLAIVLHRNVLERRAELATLRAFGFRRALLQQLITIENVFLLVVGLLLGTGAALVAVAPHLVSQGQHVPWPAVVRTLSIIALCGTAASAVAAWSALRAPLLETLKRE